MIFCQTLAVNTRKKTLNGHFGKNRKFGQLDWFSWNIISQMFKKCSPNEYFQRCGCLVNEVRDLFHRSNYNTSIIRRRAWVFQWVHVEFKRFGKWQMIAWYNIVISFNAAYRYILFNYIKYSIRVTLQSVFIASFDRLICVWSWQQVETSKSSATSSHDPFCIGFMITSVMQSKERCACPYAFSICAPTENGFELMGM